jgi:hypothetical protein
MLVRAMRSTKFSGGGCRAIREPDAVVYLLDCKQVPSAAAQDERRDEQYNEQHNTNECVPFTVSELGFQVEETRYVEDTYSDLGCVWPVATRDRTCSKAEDFTLLNDLESRSPAAILQYNSEKCRVSRNGNWGFAIWPTWQTKCSRVGKSWKGEGGRRLA